MKPLHNYVLIKVDDNDTTTPGGLIIPDSEKEEPNTGIIISVGPLADPSLTPNTKVMYERYMGISLDIDGAKHLLLLDSFILGTL